MTVPQTEWPGWPTIHGGFCGRQMSSSDSRDTTMNWNPFKRKRLGQTFLFSAIVLNGLVLAINLHLTSLQSDLQSKRYEEQYFMINDEMKRSESSKSTLLKAASNQLVMLRRLTENRLTPEERRTILNNTKELNIQSQISKVNVIAITYLLANDPPETTNVFKLFADKTDEELILLQEKYQIQAGEYVFKLKHGMVRIMDNISFWKNIHTSTLVLSTIILIMGSILILAFDQTSKIE